MHARHATLYATLRYAMFCDFALAKVNQQSMTCACTCVYIWPAITTHTHCRRQLWGTGARAPRLPASYFGDHSLYTVFCPV